jgi:large subunit ribosomal protein L24
MHVKKNDTVTVIRGASRGREGKVLEVFPAERLVLVEGVNVRKRHVRARKTGGKGQIVDRPMPISVSNVRLADAKKAKK